MHENWKGRFAIIIQWNQFILETIIVNKLSYQCMLVYKMFAVFIHGSKFLQKIVLFWKWDQGNTWSNVTYIFLVVIILNNLTLKTVFSPFFHFISYFNLLHFHFFGLYNHDLSSWLKDCQVASVVDWRSDEFKISPHCLWHKVYPFFLEVKKINITMMQTHSQWIVHWKCGCTWDTKIQLVKENKVNKKNL